MVDFIQQLLRNESGATVIEYGLIATLISIAIVGALGATGASLQASFTNVANSF